MIKSAYDLGMLRALSDLGIKLAGTDDPSMSDTGEGGQQQEQNKQDNPAEQLAQIFQQAEVPMSRQTPDNKTKENINDLDHSPKWGPPHSGTGGDAMDHGSTGGQFNGGAV